MCGICGFLALRGQPLAPDHHRRTRDMLAAMAHRGPNGHDTCVLEIGSMGANRLAIRSVRDHEPPLMHDQATGVVVVCNGEIDNHRELRSWLEERGHVIDRTSDVAVIPPLYLELGADFAARLEGVFAIAIWDPRSHELLLTRDRIGERHLYYTRDQHGVFFSSELASLRAGLTTAPELNLENVRHFLRAGYTPAPASPFAGCYKVQPAEIVTIDRDGVHTCSYWTCQLGQVPKVRKPDADAFDTIFRKAVHRQSDIDVDFGVLLSGGLDSSLLTAVARSVWPDRPLTTYGIRFAEASYDEGDYAAQVAEELGCDYVTETVGADDVPGTLHDLIHATGEPLADPAWIPLARIAERAGRDVRVVLGGEGADELFGGYPTYLGARFAGWYANLPGFLRGGLRSLIEHLPVSDKKMTVSFLLKRFVQGQDLPGLARHMLWAANMQPDVLERLGVDASLPAIPHPGMDLMDEIQCHDLRHSLPEALMAKADRGGMRHALEIRAPFLDPAVIDFAATLPVRERVRGLNTKAFLKNYALRYLPRSIVHRRKRGLSVPLAAWLRGPLHEWARSRLSSDALETAGIPCARALELLDEHQARHRDHARALWTLIVFSEWLQWARTDLAVSAAGDSSQQRRHGTPDRTAQTAG